MSIRICPETGWQCITGSRAFCRKDTYLILVAPRDGFRITLAVSVTLGVS